MMLGLENKGVLPNASECIPRISPRDLSVPVTAEPPTFVRQARSCGAALARKHHEQKSDGQCSMVRLRAA